MLVCAFLCATLHTRPRVQRAPGIPCSLCSFEGQRHANLGQITPREGEVMLGSGNAGTTPSLSSSAKAGDPVRRGLSAQSLTVSGILDRLVPATPTAFVRRRTSAVKRLRRSSAVLARRSFSEGGEPATTSESEIEFELHHVIARSPCDEAIHSSFYAARWIASLRSCHGTRIRAPRWLGMTTGWPRGGAAATGRGRANPRNRPRELSPTP